MRYLVLGSGLMGRAAAFDLLRHDDTKELILADIDESNLKSVADFLNDSRVKTVVLDAKDEALNWLEHAINIGFINYPFLNEYDPFLENIRGEKRFKKLMERVKYEWEHFEV